MIQKWEYVEMKKKHIFVKIRQSHAHLQIMIKKMARFRNSSIKGVT